jgi:hypothetical protein
MSLRPVELGQYAHPVGDQVRSPPAERWGAKNVQQVSKSMTVPRRPDARRYEPATERALISKTVLLSLTRCGQPSFDLASQPGC